MRFKTLALFLCLTWLVPAFAQMTNEEAIKLTKIQKMSFDRLLHTLREVSLPLIPEIKRTAVVSFNYVRKEVPAPIAQLIKEQVEQALASNGYQVVSISEFKTAAVTEVFSKSNRLDIVHVRSVNRFMSNGDSLYALMNRYALQGFIDCSITYDVTFGYMLNIQFNNAQSRELVTSRLITSNNQRLRSTENYFVVEMGTSIFTNAQYRVAPSNVYVDASAYTFSSSVTWRQAFNQRNSGYFGFQFGADLVMSTYNSDSIYLERMVLMPHGGARYYLCFLPRAKDDRDYYLEMFQGLAVANIGPFTLYFEQGLNFNITRNMGMGSHIRYQFSNLEFNDSRKTLQLGNFAFGFNINYRF